jgi:hypothetical protein
MSSLWVRGRVTGEQGDSVLLRVRAPQRVEQYGEGVRVVEAGVCGGPRCRVRVGNARMQGMQNPDEVDSFAGVSLGGGVLPQEGRMPKQAATPGGLGEDWQIARDREAGCRSPEPAWGI